MGRFVEFWRIFRDGNDVGSDAAQSYLDQGRDLPVSRAADGVGVACGQAWRGARLAWQPGAGFSSNAVPALLSFMINLRLGGSPPASTYILPVRGVIVGVAVAAVTQDSVGASLLFVPKTNSGE